MQCGIFREISLSDQEKNPEPPILRAVPDSLIRTILIAYSNVWLLHTDSITGGHQNFNFLLSVIPRLQD